MHACVGHPKSRATDEHERVTKDLSRRLGESLKDDEGDPKSSRVCSPPRGSLSSTMPTLHKSSSIQVAAVTRLIYQHSLKQCGMSSEVSERKMAFLGRARVRQNQSFADTNSIFALRKSQGQLARRNTLLPLTCIAVFSGLVTNSSSPHRSTDHTVTTLTCFHSSHWSSASPSTA